MARGKPTASGPSPTMPCTTEWIESEADKHLFHFPENARCDGTPSRDVGKRFHVLGKHNDLLESEREHEAELEGLVLTHHINLRFRAGEPESTTAGAASNKLVSVHFSICSYFFVNCCKTTEQYKPCPPMVRTTKSHGRRPGMRRDANLGFPHLHYCIGA